MSPVAVTGMHRTGTSLIAKTLRVAGLNLGADDDLLDPAPDNPEGFFEHAGFVHLNDDLLEATGGAWDHPPPCGPLAGDDPRVEQLRAPALDLVRSLEATAPWGWKDPRTCLTASFWLDLVPDLTFVVCVRHPIEVGLSLKRRNRSSYALGLSLWQTYYDTLLGVVPEDRRIVTHYDAHFDDVEAELERLVRFAGVPLEALASARAARNSTLRHHHVKLALADAGTAPEILALYERLCEEAGRTQAPSSPAPVPVNRTALDLEAATERLDQRARQVASLEREREQLNERVVALESAVAGVADLEIVTRRLDSIERAMHDVRYAEERLDGRSDADIIRGCRELVRRNVPSGDRVLVVAKGDSATLDLYGRAASDFPQGLDGRYLGFAFDHDSAAIAHLEALRGDGNGFLLVPDIARWWLEHYPAFADHVLHRYNVLAAEPDVGVLVDLRTRRQAGDTWPTAILETAGRLTTIAGRRPAVLDWTGAAAASVLPGFSVFAPPDDGDVLPYLDDSIDIVLVGDPDRLEEARRVAALAVVVTGDTESRLTVESVDVVAGYLTHDERRLRVVVTADAPDGAWLAQLHEAVDAEPAAELVVGGAATAVGELARDVELLAFVEEGVVPLPGCVAATRSKVSSDRVGAVAVKLFARDGAIEAAGASVFADGSTASVAAGIHDVAAPWHDYVRDTCWGPGLLVVDAALVEKLEDAWSGPAPVMHAACSARLWAAGFRVLYQPDATAVRTRPPAAADDAARDALATAWGPALPDRPARPSVLDEPAWRALLAGDDVEAGWQ